MVRRFPVAVRVAALRPVLFRRQFWRLKYNAICKEDKETLVNVLIIK